MAKEKVEKEPKKTKDVKKTEKPRKSEATEKKQETKPEKPAKKTEENYVFIGQKPVMSYVVACLTSFSAGAEKVVLKARGRAISKAVDTSEVLRRSFLKDVEVEKIDIGTEQLDRPDRPKSNVSTMEIVLAKK